jgi:transcriptional antiterminator RfaH
MEDFKAGWFVIYTKPQHERKIAEQLEKIQVNPFLPVVKTLRTWSDRRKYVDLPLFPSYVFAKLENPENYFNSLEINGVLYYVRTGKQIAAVSETVINNLKLVTTQASCGIEVSSEYLQPGQHLYIKEGPFTGFYCEVIQHKGKQKILVRIELLKRSILIDIPFEYLMPLAPVHVN